MGGKDAGDVVVDTGVVEGMRGQDGEVLRIPGVREVKSRGEDPEEDDWHKE